MKKRLNRTHPSESLSLLSLKIALTHARNEVPVEAHTQISREDANEERALQLIRMMKLQFKKDALPVHWMGSSARFGSLHEEMAGTDV